MAGFAAAGGRTIVNYRLCLAVSSLFACSDITAFPRREPTSLRRHSHLRHAKHQVTAPTAEQDATRLHLRVGHWMAISFPH